MAFALRPKTYAARLLGLAALIGIIAAPGNRKVRAASDAGTPASYAQIAPILQRNCASCHNPKGGAPFNLLTYADAKQWGEQMLEVTQSRYMPPWLPAPGRGDFIGERRLSDADLAAIRGWVGAGMPEGSATASAPTPPPEGQWRQGKPDLALELAAPIDLPASGADQFVNLLIPYTGKQAQAIRAIEIRASDPQAVRTVWLQFDPHGSLRSAHGPDGRSSIPGMEPPHEAQTSLESGGHLLVWTPDAPVLTATGGPLVRLTPGSDLVLSAHLKTTGHAEKVHLTAGLYFAKGAAGGASSASETVELAKDSALHIPPGAHTVLNGEFRLPGAVRLTAIYPRAHYLGKQLDAYATLPGGKKVWLVSIPRWDVDWQNAYRYRTPVLLPKGAVVHWDYTYDNSGDNPRNPNDPPAEVAGGSSVKDEVGDLWLEVLPPSGMPPTAQWRQALKQSAASETVNMNTIPAGEGR